MQRKALFWVLFVGLFIFLYQPVFSQIASGDVQKVFSAGKSLGAAYYHLLKLNNDAKTRPYLDIKKEYQNTLQSINIADLLIGDMGFGCQLSTLLNDIRQNLYKSLNKNDLSETRLTTTLDKFMFYYEDFRDIIREKYSYTGNWLLDLSFYTSFQTESIKSKDKAKLLLSGLNNNTENVNIMIPNNIKQNLASIRKFEKPELTPSELAGLQSNITQVMGFFSFYPNNQPLSTGINDLVGSWRGIMLTPDMVKHDINLRVANCENNLSGVMDIANLGENIPVSDIRLIDDHFTFLYKPFGSEKFYVRFGAKMLDNTFSGEITDVLGEKGYWLLSKKDRNGQMAESVKLREKIGY